MKRRFISALLISATVLALLPVLLQAQAAKSEKKPASPAAAPAIFPFNITAKKAEYDVDSKVLSYDGDVKFTSPVNSTTITCQHLDANAANAKDLKQVKASGKVVIAMTVAPKVKGKAAYKIDGTAELLTFVMTAGNKVIRLEKDKGIRPTLIMTNLTSKEKTDMSGTGDVIEYNIETRKLTIHQVEVTSRGNTKPKQSKATSKPKEN
ncbi:MAG: hypothetical protein ACYDBB_00775 [Armatimonadota bacterium]